MAYSYDYPRPAVTVDCAIFSAEDGQLEILLIERGQDPFAGKWATPGGFVDIDEPIEAAAHRELDEETGMSDVPLYEYATFGRPGRDPRGRIIAVAHWGLTNKSEHDVAGADDASDAQWFAVDDLPPLAFDHDDLIGEALGTVRRRARCGPLGLGVLKQPFELEDLRGLYQTVLGREITLESFRASVRDAGFLIRTDDSGALYRFDEERYRELEESGIANFE